MLTEVDGGVQKTPCFKHFVFTQFASILAVDLSKDSFVDTLVEYLYTQPEAHLDFCTVLLAFCTTRSLGIPNAWHPHLPQQCVELGAKMGVATARVAEIAWACSHMLTLSPFGIDLSSVARSPTKGPLD